MLSARNAFDSFPGYSRNRPGDKGNEPACVDAQTHTMEETVHRFGPAHERRHERQQEMKRHAGQGGNPDEDVPLGHYPRREAIEKHLVGAHVITQESEPENEQVLSVQSLLARTEHRPGIENKGKVHPDDGLEQHVSSHFPIMNYEGL
jgi:hypothetical protein